MSSPTTRTTKPQSDFGLNGWKGKRFVGLGGGQVTADILVRSVTHLTIAWGQSRAQSKRPSFKQQATSFKQFRMILRNILNWVRHFVY